MDFNPISINSYDLIRIALHFTPQIFKRKFTESFANALICNGPILNVIFADRNTIPCFNIF